MGNATIALVFVVIVNMFLFILQASVIGVDATGTKFYDSDGTVLENDNSYQLDTANIANDLPTSEGSLSPTTGNIFTDTFSSAKNWILKNTVGLRNIYTMLAAPYNMLARMGLPPELSFAIGSSWYALSLFVLLSFLWKGDS